MTGEKYAPCNYLTLRPAGEPINNPERQPIKIEDLTSHYQKITESIVPSRTDYSQNATKERPSWMFSEEEIDRAMNNPERFDF